MECNLLKNCIVNYNTDIGTISLDFYKTQNLFDMDIAVQTTLSSGTIFCLDIDFLDRIYSDKFKYYFLSDFNSSTVASGIFFSYKNYDFEEYSVLPTMVENDYYYTTFSGEAFYPRYLRVVHNLNSISGSLYGMSVTNKDDIVNFGNDGLAESEVATPTRAVEYIKPIKIYNNNDSKAVANIQIDALDNYLDSYIFLSASQEGPWTSVISTENQIAAANTWTLGTIGTGLEEENGTLMLKGEYSLGEWASNLTEATYRTKVFTFDNKFYSNLYISMYGGNLGCRVSVDDTDGTSTIAVKSLEKPINYSIYRVLTAYYDSNRSALQINCKDYDLISGNLVSTLAEDIFYIDNTSTYNYIVNINDRGYTAFLFGATERIYLCTFGTNFVLKYTRELLNESGNSHYLYDVAADFGGGAWAYLYSGVGDSSYPINQKGYFLFHYNNANSQTLKLFSSTRDIYAFSVVPNGSDIWYTNITDDTLTKLNINGQTLYSVMDETTDDLRGCCSLEDGGCWYINGNNIYRVDDSGTVIDTISAVSYSNTMANILVHVDGSLFVRDGEYIYRISTIESSKGFKYFTVRIPYASKLIQGDAGVWVYCTTGFTYYLSEVDGTIINTKGSALGGPTRVFGIFNKNADDIAWTTKFPISTDPLWSTNPFNKVQTNSYYFPKDLYHQVEVTLQCNKPYDKYDVPYTIDTWDPNDTFDNLVEYSHPYEHRWEYHNKVQIDTVSGTCLLYCGEADPINDPHVYIRTNGRWYIKGEVNSEDVGSAYDIQVDYILPDEGNVTLYISVTPQNNNSDYVRAVLRRIGSVMTFKIEDHQSNFYWGDIIGPEVVIDPVQNSGKIRLKKSGAKWGQAYFYSYLTDSWLSSTIGLNKQSPYYPVTDFDLEKNWNIRIDAYGAGIVTIDNFKVNDADVYWYFDSPKIKGLYLRDYITTDEIYPNNYKDIYLKMLIPSSEVNYVPNTSYDYKLKVWWELQL